MKKHIKVRGKYVPTTGKITVQVVEQSHHYDEFGNFHPNHWKDPAGFKLGNCLLVSHSSHGPQFHEFKEQSQWWFLVQGGDPYTRLFPFEVTAEQWNKLKELVLAYNEWGATQ